MNAFCLLSEIHIAVSQTAEVEQTNKTEGEFFRFSHPSLTINNFAMQGIVLSVLWSDDGIVVVCEMVMVME